MLVRVFKIGGNQMATELKTKMGASLLKAPTKVRFFWNFI
jgi:hypothetical protein